MSGRCAASVMALGLAAAFSISSEAVAATQQLTMLQEPTAAKTYLGCPAPAAPTRAFYVDPVNGSMSGDGSQAHPWHTLAEVVSSGLISTMPSHFDPITKTQINNNPNAPIKPGAIIYLLSGNHGNVNIQGWYGGKTTAYDNSDFITIAAAPGQTPVLTQLVVVGGNKWAFRGLTIEGINTGQYITAYDNVYNDYWLVHFWGPHNNIIFDNNHLLSQPDVSAWGLVDWQQKRASGIADDAGNCIAITNNSLQNVGFGMETQNSKNVLIGDNLIDHFSDDGIDFGSSNLRIVGNAITNSIEDGDGFHRDGMQGQPYTPTSTYNNITIERNTVIRITDPALPFPATLQGIDDYSGYWTNVVVSNNVVITKATNGISFYGVYHAVFRKNIVLADGGKSYNCDFVVDAITFQKCLAVSITYDTSNILSLNVAPGTSNKPSSNVTIDSNIVNSLQIVQDTSPVTMLTNRLTSSGKALLGIPIADNTRMFWTATPGTYYDNTILSGDPASVFRTFDNTNMIYDLRLK